MQCGPGAFQHLDIVHGPKRNGKIEIVVRGLRIVDAKSIQHHQRLLKAAAAQNNVRLRATGSALLQKHRRVLAQKFERRFSSQFLAFQRQHHNRTRRLRHRHWRGRTQYHHGLSARRNRVRLRRWFRLSGPVLCARRPQADGHQQAAGNVDKVFAKLQTHRGRQSQLPTGLRKYSGVKGCNARDRGLSQRMQPSALHTNRQSGRPSQGLRQSSAPGRAAAWLTRS